MENNWKQSYRKVVVHKDSRRFASAARAADVLQCWVYLVSHMLDLDYHFTFVYHKGYCSACIVKSKSNMVN